MHLYCTNPDLPMVLDPRSLTFPSPPPCLLSIFHVPSLPLPHSFLFTNKTPRAYLCIPSLPHRHVYFCSHFAGQTHLTSSMGILLAHTLTDTCFTTQLVVESHSLSTDTQTPPVHASVPQLVHPLPVRSIHHSSYTLPSADSPSPGHSDTPLTLAGLSPP